MEIVIKVFTIGNRLFSPAAADESAVNFFLHMPLTHFFREVGQLSVTKSGKIWGPHPVSMFHTFQKTTGCF